MGYSDPPFDRPPVPQGQHYNPHHGAPWPQGLPPRLPLAYPQPPPGARPGPPSVPPHPGWPAVPPAGPPLLPAAGFAPPQGHPGFPPGSRPGLPATASAAHPGSSYPPAWLRPPPPQAWARPQAPPPPPLSHVPPMAAQPTRGQPAGALQPAAPVHQPIITAEEIMAMAKEQEEEERKAEAEKEAKRQEEQKRLREEARKQRLAALRERQQAEAWTAHKSDDGRVYFYNTLTEQSSWEKPSGYTGPVEVVEGEPEPVSFKPIKGTAWTQVSCKDGRTYYSNSATGATAWCLPDELLEVLADIEEDAAASSVQPLTAETAGILARVAAASGGSTLRPEYKSYLGGSKGAPGPSAGPGLAAASGEDAAGGAAAAGLAGRTAAGAGNGAGPSGAQLTKEEAVLKFKELLLDAGVTPFSRFEKEATKLAKDSRWSLVPQRERRLIFDAFCKNVATEQRRLKEERAAASRRSFLDLIALFLAELRADAASQKQRQEHVDADAEMVEAAAADAAAAADGEVMAASSAHGDRDEMPTAADEREEGEAPEDEEPGDNGFGSGEREEAAAAVTGRGQERGPDEEPAVVAVPADTPEDPGVPADVDVGTMEQRWGDDARWRACPAALRQELFAELVEPLVQQAQRRRDRLQKHWRSLFTALLTDQAGMRPGAELPRLERWPELSLNLRADARFRAVPRQHHRAFFEEHLRHLQALESAKRKEAEERRNSRRELAERAEKHGEEAHRRRMRAQHSEAVAAFRTLLAEVVKDAAAQWRDWRIKLERDPQGRAKSDVLPVPEMESIFREHLSNLKGAIHKRYRQLLTEAIAPLLPQTRRAHDLAMAAAPSATASSGELPEAAVNWEAALPLLEGDARFQRMPASDRETVWRKFVDDLMGGKEDPGAPAKPEPAVRPAASSGPPVASAPPPNQGVMTDDRPPGRDRRGTRPPQAPREEESRQPAAAGSSRHGAAADQLDGEGGGRRHERARQEREPDQDRGRARDLDRHRPSERGSHHREGAERDRDRDHHRDREREDRDRERPRDRDRDWDRGRDRDRDRDKKRARH